jgi:hypothetical protein
LKLVDLVPAAVDAFYASEIGVGHALLLAKLPADQQQQALSACFKEVYNSSQNPARILLPVRNLQFWIETNVLLILKDAPFDKRDAQLVSTAGSCADCPKRSQHSIRRPPCGSIIFREESPPLRDRSQFRSRRFARRFNRIGCKERSYGDPKKQHKPSPTHA